jgi:hypothetical protein
MKPFSLLCVLVALALTGCGTLDVDVTSWERSSLLADAPKLPTVRLSAAMLSHNDQLVFVGITHQIASEKIFRAVFTGNEDSPASLDLVGASLSRTETSLTKKLVVSYKLEVALRYRGQRHAISATAEGKGWGADIMMRDAIERATIDVARQCERILAAN